MTSLADKPSRARRRRTHDAGASRRALLDAAHELFDARGYDRATTRDIGERAKVDPALIARYFGSKEGLYIAAMGEEPLGSSAAELDFEPHGLVALMLERWDERGHSPISRAMASPTLSDDVREQIHSVVGRRVVEPLASELRTRGVPRPELRAELLVAFTLGIAVTRSNRTLTTLASAPAEEILAALGPLIDTLQDVDGVS
ncbi:MAG TPA: TetR family transcriptional regulator [Solirubrobacteraceae bacterium]|nr:TetR family transcriptional regulator [Solirubrobacteraceae bacterium]